MSIMSSIEQARWFVREKKHKAKEEAEGEQKKSSIPGQGQHLQRLRSATNAASLVTQMVKSLPAVWDPWRRE